MAIPDWLKAIFPAQSWKMVLLPIAFTVLSMFISGITVSCEDTSQHVTATRYFSEGGLGAVVSTILLPYGISMTADGINMNVQSSLVLGALAILLGMLAAIRITKRDDEGLWMIGPYWVLSIVSLLLLLVKSSEVQVFPLLAYALGTPVVIAIAAKILARYFAANGWLVLESHSRDYGAVVRTAVQGAQQAASTASTAAARAVTGVSNAVATPPSGGSRPAPFTPGQPAPDVRPAPPPPVPPAAPMPPAVPPSAVQALPPDAQPEMPLVAPPHDSAAPDSAPALAALDAPVTPVMPAPPAITSAPVQPAPQRVQFAVVCPFCGNPKVQRQQPGQCSQCNRNLEVLLEKPGNPRCGACDGILLVGARFCHHCGGLLADVGAAG